MANKIVIGHTGAHPINEALFRLTDGRFVSMTRIAMEDMETMRKDGQGVITGYPSFYAIAGDELHFWPACDDDEFERIVIT